MSQRFVAIWFRHLTTDALSRQQPELRHVPFVLAAKDHGRLVITAANPKATSEGITTGMVVADARAILPGLHVVDEVPGRESELLHAIAEWCIRYAPITAVDIPDVIFLDCSGCAHLWGGETEYVEHLQSRLNAFGYSVRISMADTIGTAWAIARYGRPPLIVAPGAQFDALLPMPAASLRLDRSIIELVVKLGLRQVKDFIGMPATALRRRFGKAFVQRLAQALGQEEENLQPVQPIEPYQERLPCLEPIVTAIGIEIAVKQLLDQLCLPLKKVEKGLRQACLKCYRVDGKIESVSIGTNRPSNNIPHLFKLFEYKLPTIEPALGIELFVLEAPIVEDIKPLQEKLWEGSCGLESLALSRLIDHLSIKIGAENIHRYLPDEHHWPERSIKNATTLDETASIPWKREQPRPMQLLASPQPIEVTAPIPDYPPMLFRYKGQLHKIKKADGPERIEQEWWLQEGQHRDYYAVEDEEGKRYWLFRLGHYDAAKTYQWFIHGFFA
ncbi:MAG: DNA polymerase Y family protein [Bacteroidota bacterium]